MNQKNLIWLDLEMTGLDPNINKIIEIATVITDHQLNILDIGPIMAIYQNHTILNKMDPWNITTHTQTGLIKKVKNSTINEYQAEKKTIEFLTKWVKPQCSPLCGNTINQDRNFLKKYMPKLESYFHYRNIDVSTLKELAKRWKLEITHNIKKKKTHSALSDIYDSIEELLFYKKFFIKN
ncbi:oligoribonuclease [Buchnera aphidicola (Thelaxes californica)]|uniref:Oligoribonuclease n=1 Tax=Buchnera aphidicola (Thelaxes californica) TaxID=1315998 RepID=A0A4D6YLW3_9GAMM|nr:oligoribonuclease [Buchnera aphidicola]QCI26964.1 oligoribonuclease [Buchnera aphidicola (Thelaxes californica)]